MDASTRARILVADDSPLILDMVRQVLEAAGHTVLTAPDGLAAINMVLRERPDLIISDVEMPEMTGLQLCRLLKGDPRTRGIPFLILSAHKEQYEQFWGRESGADDYLPKPFGPPALLERVQALLARFPRHSEPGKAIELPVTTRIEALEKVNASLERRLFEQTIIHGISTIAATASGERDTARAVLERLSRLVELTAGAFAFAKGGTSYVLVRGPVHPRTLQRLHAAIVTRLPLSDGELAAPALVAGAEYISERHPDSEPAIAVQPLQAAGHPVGFLGVARASGRDFDEPERELLDLVAGQAALVLENARLVEAERAHAQALAEQNDELRRLNRTITDLIATVTHDLRTPLTSVIGYLEFVLEDTKLQEETAEFVQIARRNGERMLQMINDILDLSRLEARRTPITPSPVPLSPILEEVVTLLRPDLDAKRQVYSEEIPADLPALMVDPDRLHQVLLNLLGNASKYTPEGGRIRASARVEGDRVRIAIQDTGMGLSKEDLRQVFGKFFRAQRPEMTGVTGTGLGLAIVKTVVELHGGEVFAESRLNEGSTFGCLLPIARAPR
jgi:signal transduction histidine kinase